MNEPPKDPSTSVLVRISGVADILGGISRQAANEHTYKPGFPAPHSTDELGRRWLRSDVVAYQQARTTKEETPMPDTRIVEHSANAGRTWEPCEYGSRSVLAHKLQTMEPYEIHDDGLGNLYRWRPSDA